MLSAKSAASTCKRQFCSSHVIKVQEACGQQKQRLQGMSGQGPARLLGSLETAEIWVEQSLPVVNRGKDVL